jgi:tetratricopeptide (TPR) repeat protein
VTRRHTLSLIILGAVCLLPQLLVVIEWYRPGPWNLPVIDALTYEDEALRILEGRPTPSVYWQAPGYPYFLAGVFAAAGWSARNVALVQALLGALTCLLTYLIARRWLPGPWALAACVICALYGPRLYFGAQLLRPALFAFLLMVWLWAHLRIRRARGGWGALASGALLGLAALVRENALLLVPAVALWEAFAQRAEIRARARWRAAALVILGTLLVVAPVTIRNWAIGRELVPISSSGGINFYIGNHPETARVQAIRPGEAWDELTALPRREGSALHPGERSRYFFREALAFWCRDPAGAVGNTLHKTVAFLSAQEVPRNQDPYEGRRHSTLLAILLWRWGGIGFPFGLIGPLALLGLIACWRGRPPLRFLAFVTLISAAGVIAFFPAARYRVPLVALFACLAVTGLLWWWGLVRRAGSRRRGIAATLLLVAAFVLVNGGWVVARENPADTHFMRAWTLIQRDRPSAAIGELERALSANPTHMEALTNLAALRGRRGETVRAATLARRAVAIDSAHARARVNLALAQLGSGQVAQGESSLVRALRLQPDLGEAWSVYLPHLTRRERLADALRPARLAARRWPRDPTGWVRCADILLQLARWTEAEADLRCALDLNRRNPHAWFKLGVALSEQGRQTEAQSAWRETLRYDPGHMRARARLSAGD